MRFGLLVEVEWLDHENKRLTRALHLPLGRPIRLRIDKGYIRAIEGDLDADFLREYMRQFNDPEAYAVSHLGWGLQPRARWSHLRLVKGQTKGNDGRSFYGNFMFSTGPNTDAGASGTRSATWTSPCATARCRSTAVP